MTQFLGKGERKWKNVKIATELELMSQETINVLSVREGDKMKDILKKLKPVPYDQIEVEFSELSGLEIDEDCTDFRCGCADFSDSDFIWKRIEGEEYYFRRQEYEALEG